MSFGNVFKFGLLLGLAAILYGCSESTSSTIASGEPVEVADESEAPAAPEEAVDLAEVHWPSFRGPLGNGHAVDAEDAPLRWSETEGVAWKTAIPHIGWSSPMILGNQIWLTTATEKGSDFLVIQVNALTGEIEFDERLFHADDPEPLNNEVNSYASPSPALEPGRVYVHFGTYGTACLDANTK